MKFDVIIGNPPYSGFSDPLYLKVLYKVFNIGNRIVWLCPSQWTQTLKPNQYYEKYRKFFGQRLDYYKNVGNPFFETQGTRFANSIGLYSFGEKQKINIDELKWEKFSNKELAKSIYSKLLKYTLLNKSLEDKKEKTCTRKFCVKGTELRGSDWVDTKPDWDWTTLWPEANRNDFTKEHSAKHPVYWNFDTENECRNFVDYCEHDIIMFALYLYKINNHLNRGELKIVPWVDDYTKPWTTEKLKNEFKLNNNEVSYIIEEMKPFGYKNCKK